MEEALIFETGRFDATGVDIDEPGAIRAPARARMRARSASICPGLTEPETLRHYVRLSRNNYAIDAASTRSAPAR